jgi:RHS repeat-associated protein
MTRSCLALFRLRYPRPRASGPARPARRRLVAVASALALAAGLAAPPGAAAATPAGHRPVPPAQKPVPVYAVRGHRAKVPVMTSWHRPATVWPSPGTATVALPAAAAAGVAPPARLGNAALAGPGPGAERAGSMPVWAGPAGQAGAKTNGPGATVPSRVRVSVASRQAAAAAGVKGVIFTVSRADGSAAPGRVHVSLDYSSFAYAYGGDYAARLHLVELPGCALTRPQQAACRRQTPLDSADDVRTRELGADLTLPGTRPGAAAPATLVLAGTPSPAGSAGDFTATTLSEAGQWSAGGSNGSFDYSYPIQVPPVPGGLEPDVSLTYDSQSVDGLTSSTNDQASWIGDGWDYSPGYVEEDYQSCETEPPDATNWSASGDFCFSSNDTVTLSLNGQNTTLVHDDGNAGWHPEVDNGERVQYLTGASNGTNDGGYWVITTQDGTSYYFGLGDLPGGATTDSAWTMPVFASSSGQPCYKAEPTPFADSYCPNVAWRWNLDYVTDPHQDAIAYFYQTETNYYARANGTTADAAYTQAGALSKIEYGLRAGAVSATASPAAVVTFTTTQTRTDIPSDLTCTQNTACGVISPTFWEKYQLTTIATQALEGSSLASVDSWALAQSYPATGDITSAPSLWLKSITRTGQDTAGGGPAVTLPEVSFAGQALPNRIESPAELSDGYSIITRFRLTTITNETGGVTTVNYLAPSGGCTSGSLPAPDANTLQCYPDYWNPTAGNPILDWFSKYVVNEISQQDTTGNAPPVVTTYSYSGAAWHYNDDALTRSQERTWDQWRGYRTVTTYTGPATAPDTKVTDTYFQGMDGDYQNGGGTSSVSLTSSQGDTVTDSDQYAGMDFEHIVYDGPAGAMVTDTITIPWSSAATASHAQPTPLPALTAHLTGTAQTKTYTALASGGDREATITYTHDSYGRVTTTSSIPDTSDPTEDTCTTTSYAANTSAWILDLPAEVQVVSVPCTTTPTLPADAVSDDLTFYDGATSLSADTPVTGDITQTQKATSYSGSTPVYTTESTSSYDEYGRVQTAKDADQRETQTAYTPATGAEPTSVQVTDPMGLVTTTTYDPARDLPLTVTNPAGWATTKTYDGLGRLTAVWTPGHPSNTSAQYTYSYDICGPEASPPASCSGTALAQTVVTTSTLEPDGTSYLTSDTFYDSLGRVRETQTETPDGNRDVTDTIYNADGWTTLVSNAYYANGAPGTCPGSGTPPCLVASPDDQVPSQTGYVYDGAGRVTRQISYTLAAETWETDTAYGGDTTTTSYQNLIPGQPTGGTPQTIFTNGLGLTSKIYQYHQGVPADPSDPASDYDQTSYTYTPAGQLASITDAANDTWGYTYTLAGDQKSQSDPDAGTTHSSYDNAGQLMSVTDARDDQISYTYDLDGRKTGEYDTTGGAAESSSDELASWTYDTLALGQLTSSTSYYDGSAYTEEITGYNSYGLPKATETIIPAAQGALVGTYITVDSYNAATGLPSGYEDSAAGGLPQETVGYGLNAAAQPTSLGGYVTNLTYTELGQPQEYTLGSGSNAWMTDTWDPQTGLLTQQLTQTQTGTSPVTVDDQHYTYDNTGQITSEADTPPGGATQVQCFTYDYLGRLSQAWSQGSTSCSGGPSQQAESGAAAPYWEQYSYNSENDMTGETSTPPSGPATTITNGFPAAGSAQPHAISSQTTTGPSGTTTSSYSYNADGDLTTVSGPQAETLSWDDADRLAQLTTASGTTSYLYDADGNLLIRKDPSSSTLYLPDEEITASGSALSATRYYSIGGQTIAARTSTGAVYYLTGDQQGTQTLAINAATLAVSQRYYDPFGSPVGAPPSSWPGDQGFQDGPADPATGLDDLGAREYDPGTASFISPDPLLTPGNPQDLNPYAYAADTPPTGQDPTGAMWNSGAGYVGGGWSDNNGQYTTSPGPYHDGGTSAPGKKAAGNSDQIVEISPNLWLYSNNPHLAAYQAAWDWVIQNFGPPHSAGAELADWGRICWNSPYHQACTGQLGAYLMAPPINPALGNLWNDGGITLLGNTGSFAGTFVPAESPEAGAENAEPALLRTSGGRVTFRPPPGATPQEIAQVKAYCDQCNLALEDGALSPTGRVSTSGALRAAASRSAAMERAAAIAQGNPYTGQAGHVPDTTWTGDPDPWGWMDLAPRVNASLGGQAVQYPIGYMPDEFYFEP